MEEFIKNLIEKTEEDIQNYSKWQGQAIKKLTILNQILRAIERKE